MIFTVLSTKRSWTDSYPSLTFPLPKMTSVISVNHKKGGQDKSTSKKGLALPFAVFPIQFWQAGVS